MIDIRADSQIAADGVIPGALIIHRNVLEWRLDPESGHSHRDAPNLNDHVIVVCNEGYQSSLAALILQELGFHRATDLEGGFQGLARHRSSGQPPAGTSLTRGRLPLRLRVPAPEREAFADPELHDAVASVRDHVPSPP